MASSLRRPLARFVGSFSQAKRCFDGVRRSSCEYQAARPPPAQSLTAACSCYRSRCRAGTPWHLPKVLRSCEDPSPWSCSATLTGCVKEVLTERLQIIEGQACAKQISSLVRRESPREEGGVPNIHDEFLQKFAGPWTGLGFDAKSVLSFYIGLKAG